MTSRKGYQPYESRVGRFSMRSRFSFNEVGALFLLVVFTTINASKEKFIEYKELIEGNDIYYITIILDPWIKTQ